MCVSGPTAATTGSESGTRKRSESSAMSKKSAIEEMKSMRIFLILAAAFFLTGTAHAQSDNAGDHAIQDRSYKLLREDENWTFLRNRALRQDFWDPIKFIPLRNRADDWYLTIRGEAREVWEQIGNDNWGQQPYMNGYLNDTCFRLTFTMENMCAHPLSLRLIEFILDRWSATHRRKGARLPGRISRTWQFQRRELHRTPCWQAGTRVRLWALD